MGNFDSILRIDRTESCVNGEIALEAVVPGVAIRECLALRIVDVALAQQVGREAVAAFEMAPDVQVDAVRGRRFDSEEPREIIGGIGATLEIAVALVIAQRCPHRLAVTERNVLRDRRAQVPLQPAACCVLQPRWWS